jgi:hypothetical protein
MYRDAVFAIVIGLATCAVTADPSFAFGHGGGMGGHAGPAMTSVTPAAVSYGSARLGGGPVPLVRKLSGRGVVKCIRACMHGVDASWAEFCEYSCVGP